jgi:sporulation protein YlmC with PRC-barrel domain
MRGEVRLELLLGRMVRDADGRKIGRIEEMRAVPKDNQWVVTHFLLGPTGWRERLSIRGFKLHLRSLRGSRRSNLARVRSVAVDLSDPRHPRLRSPAARSTRRAVGVGKARRLPTR